MNLRWILLLMVPVAGCVTANRIFTISEARVVAEPKKEKRIRVAGYFVDHYEGSSLEPKPGGASAEGLPLRWASTLVLIPRQHVRAFQGKHVVLVGLLKVGPIFGERYGDFPYLEVQEIKEANKSLEPTTMAVTPRAIASFDSHVSLASARGAPAMVVAHL
jgi:hypothetical protein